MHSLSSVCLLLKGQQGGLDRSDQLLGWLDVGCERTSPKPGPRWISAKPQELRLGQCVWENSDLAFPPSSS